MNITEPMLAGKADIKKLQFPLLASPKLDGIRCIIQGGIALSRSLKPIANVNVQKALKGLPDGLDGELIMGDPTARDAEGRSVAFRLTSSCVMSDDKSITGVALHAFDLVSDNPFLTRLLRTRGVISNSKNSYIKYVSHHTVSDLSHLLTLEEWALEQGYEGLILRSPQGPYKCGRSTTNEGWMLKLKRTLDAEALVIGMEELFHNDNSASTNELGRTHRCSVSDGLRPGNVLGSLVVRDIKSGVEFNVGTGFDVAQRQLYWTGKNEDDKPVVGRIIKYRYFPVGGKDKPRHPVFLGWRDPRDMSKGATKLKPKVKIETEGPNGNVFVIIGNVAKALKSAGLIKESIAFTDRALTRSSYADVLKLCAEYVEVL